MTNIILFHSVLGVRAGVHDAAERLRGAGHDVVTPDLFSGRTFDDYAVAGAHAESIGFQELTDRAKEIGATAPPGSVVAGFSAGAGLAQQIAATRPDLAGLVMIGGALPPPALGVDAWPKTVPVSIHLAERDPFVPQGGAAPFQAFVERAGADIVVHEYPCEGHLYTDPSLPQEYDPAAAALTWKRVLGFVAA